MKHILVLTTLSLFILVSCARVKNESTTALVRTPSMVCGSCAKTIKDAVAKLDGVEEVNADLATKTVTVKFIPAKLNLDNVEKAITAAGYDANDKKRDRDAYEKLDKCCKIDG